MHVRRLLLSFMSLLLSQALLAAENAMPFGVEVGVSTLRQVQQQLGNRAPLQPAGQNRFSGGNMFDVDGAGLEVEGVNKATFIFDASDVLAGVVVSMAKDPKSLARSFSGKYKVVANRINSFMNYGYAKFQKGDSVIEIDAPHLSFQMEVRYVTSQLLAAFTQQINNDKNAREQRRNNAL